jgi:4-hydroxybenzoate polyprenyltransferase
MIGAKKLWKQAQATLQRRLAQPQKYELMVLSDQPKSLARYYSAQEKPSTTKEVKAEDTGGYYKERIKMNDPYYDPYYPCVWMPVMPRSWQPYLRFCRIDQNFGRMLLLNPHLWGIAIAAPLGCPPDLINLGLFFVGSLFSHAASCAIDDFCDVPIDKKNVRTQLRPLVAKTMGRPAGAAIIGGLLCGTFGILSMLSPTAIQYGLLATPTVFAYPFMKRFFQYPQVFLAFSLNLGVFMGFGAVTNFISWPVCLPLYFGGIAYTIFYDSIYAFQDIEADTKAGAFSTSQKFVKHAKAISGGLAATTVSLHALAGYMAGLHPAFFGVMGIGAAHLAWQTWKLDPKNAPLCDHLLNISYRYGTILVLAYIVGVYFAKSKKKQVEAKLAAKPVQVPA